MPTIERAENQISALFVFTGYSFVTPKSFAISVYCARIIFQLAFAFMSSIASETDIAMAAIRIKDSSFFIIVYLSMIFGILIIYPYILLLNPLYAYFYTLSTHRYNNFYNFVIYYKFISNPTCFLCDLSVLFISIAYLFVNSDLYLLLYNNYSFIHIIFTNCMY